MLFCGNYSFLKENLIKTVKNIKKQNPLSKITFVVHSNQMRLYIKEILTESLGILANTEFYTLIDISKKLSGIEPIEDFDKQLILKKFLYEEKLNLDGLAEDFSILIKQLKEYQIPLENIKSPWIKNIIKKYENFKKENNFYDREDVHQKASENKHLFETDYLFIIGIKSVPALHQQMLKNLKKLTKEKIYVFVPFIFDSGYYQNYDHFKEVRQFYEELTDNFAQTGKEEDPNTKLSTLLFKYQYDTEPLQNRNIKIIEGKTKKEEVESIAKEIAYLLKEDTKPDQIGVIIPDFQAYLTFIKEIFPRYYIPYYLTEENRYIDDLNYQKIYALFEIKNKNFSKESLLKILSKDLLCIENIEEIEKQIILSPAIEKPEEWENHIKNELFINLLKDLNNIPEENYIEDFIESFEQILEKYIKPSKEKEFLKEIFLSLKENPLYKTLFSKINYQDFTGIIKTFFEKENKENRVKGNTITILKPTSAEGNNFTYIFFLGLNQGVFPALYKDELIISASQLNGFDYKYHLLMQQLANFANIFDKNKIIYLSYSSDKETSVFLEEVKRILFPKWYFEDKKATHTPAEIYLKKEFVIKHIDHLKDTLEDIKTLSKKQEKFENPQEEDFKIDTDINFPISPTDFQIYALCPYRFYLEKILQIQETEIPDRKRIPPVKKGILVHEILKEFFLSLDLENPYIDEEKIKKQYYEGINNIEGINQLLESVLPSYRPFEEKKANILFNRMISFIKEDIERLKKEQKTVAKEYLEKSFSDSIFKGRIDRVDKDKEEYFYIYDYKTGEYPPKDFENEIKTKYLQLTIYKRFLEKEEKKVKEIGLFFINDKSNQKLYTTIPDTEIDRHIENLLNSLKENMFIPVENTECQYCQFFDICKKDQIKGRE